MNHMKSAGYNLDDKRDKIDDNDIPNVITKWKEQATTNLSDRKSKCFMALVEEIRDNNYDKPIAFSPRRRRRLSRFGQGSWRNPDNGRRHLKCRSPEYGVLPL